MAQYHKSHLSQALNIGMREFMNIVENKMLSELKGVRDFRTVSMKTLVDMLERNGFKPIGEGYFSYVYERGNEAVKLYFDKCYDQFIALARANPNPHFPKFKGNSVKFGPSIRMIRMEKLTPITPFGEADRVARMVKSYYNAARDGNEVDYEVPEEEKGLFEACRILYENNKANCYFDMHGANVMMRGSTIVITDPFSD